MLRVYTELEKNLSANFGILIFFLTLPPKFENKSSLYNLLFIIIIIIIIIIIGNHQNGIRHIQCRVTRL